jgi:hypothetical protein
MRAWKEFPCKGVTWALSGDEKDRAPAKKKQIPDGNDRQKGKGGSRFPLEITDRKATAGTTEKPKKVFAE